MEYSTGTMHLVSWCAYVDESEPDPRFGGAGVYILAAALVAHDDQDTVRQAMRALRLRGQRKLHWHDESDQRRKLVTETIAVLPALHLIVVRVDVGARSERRRRLCLARLLHELDTAGIAEVHLESRAARQNGLDLELLNRLRQQKAISSRLRIHHQPGPSEPLLWVPDVVAGAAGAQRRGDPSYIDRLSESLTFYEV